MKKWMAILATMLCVLLAATAAAEGKTYAVDAWDKANNPTNGATLYILSNDDKPLGTDKDSSKTEYYLGAVQAWQHWLQNNTINWTGLSIEYGVYTPQADADLSGSHRVRIPFEAFSKELTTQVQVLYGVFGENGKRWKAANCGEVGTYSVDGTAKGIEVYIPVKDCEKVPVIILWRTNKKPNNPPAPVGPVNPPADGAVDMPQTGDNSNLALMIALLGMSVAALGVMKLRRRVN